MAKDKMNISIDHQLKEVVESLRAQGVYAQDLLLEALQARRAGITPPQAPPAPPGYAPPPPGYLYPPQQLPRQAQADFANAQNDAIKVFGALSAEARKDSIALIKVGIGIGQGKDVSLEEAERDGSMIEDLVEALGEGVGNALASRMEHGDPPKKTSPPGAAPS